jgi:hypothetical protein
MPKIKYQDFNFQAKTLRTIAQANEIISEYAAQGFDLTLRQLYYQFVARGYLENKQANYDKLGSIINDARLAGMIDWEAISDRTRNLRSNSHWDSPADVINSAAEGFAIDLWNPQKYRPEVWIEKDALVGVIAGACQENDVPYFSCRGYTSQSEMWAAGMRFARYDKRGKIPLVIHLGDHDPSGIDMSRDIADRLEMLSGVSVEVRRIALNMDQVEKYNPPPNPAKATDCRFADYQNKYGDESWELDSLSPIVIAELITGTLNKFRDKKLWAESVEQQEEWRKELRKVSREWESVREFAMDL